MILVVMMMMKIVMKKVTELRGIYLSLHLILYSKGVLISPINKPNTVLYYVLSVKILSVLLLSIS